MGDYEQRRYGTEYRRASDYIKQLRSGELKLLSDGEVWTTRSRTRLRAEIMFMKELLAEEIALTED